MRKKIVCMYILCILSCLGFCQNLFAYLEFRSDFISSFFLSSGSDLMVRSHNGIYLGIPGFAVGGIYLYEPLHSYVTDSGYGLAIRGGENIYLELGGGYYERDYEGLKGQGYFISLIPGFNLHQNFGFAIPIIAKKINSGDLDKRWIIDVLPYIGMKIRY